MPLQATSGAASYDAFGGGVPVVPNYIEDVFSTYLYTGTGGTAQTINNGIDLSTKGGLVWIKSRSNAFAGGLQDTARGVSFQLIPSQTVAQYNNTTNGFTSFNNNGFSLQNDYTFDGSCNNTGSTYASWTFRKQPKFFDIVTYTGDGTSSRGITHALTSVPGMVMIKRTDSTGGWATLNRFDNTEYRIGSPGYSTPCGLNYTAALLAGNITTYASSTVFNVGSSLWGATETFNTNGATYVAYLFAHDAGGFGLTGTDNVISCGSFTTTTGGVANVNLGYEPQWVMMKPANNSASNWEIYDVMRGSSNSGSSYLNANTSGAEGSTTTYRPMIPTATGFTTSGWWGSGLDMIYIAIRRGPMKVPTSGTSVFSPISITPSSGTVSTTNFPVDFMITTEKTTGGTSRIVHDKLRGVGTVGAGNARTLITNDTTEEFAGSSVTYNWWNTGFTWGAGFAGEPMVAWNFKRAPSFFDEVCYTGVDSGDLTLNHNLSVPYEMLVIKRRSGVGNWFVMHSGLTDATKYIRLNTTNGQLNAGVTVQASTNTTFLAPAGLDVTVSGSTYVAYLFATCAGVSKCFSYTGNGSSQTINCGFTAGSRWIMIKRTDSTGDWYVWDSARGIIAGNDPHLSLNTTAAEVTTDDSVDTDNTGFIVNQLTATNINVTSATYIGIAIA